jgi:REP element-mobilizing transposase RayT
MRIARRKMRGYGCYYHLYNRVCGLKSYLPFGEHEKEYAFNLIHDLSRYFLLEIISVCWMGNHCHIVLYAPGEPPDLKAAAERHNAYYAKRGDQLSPISHASRLAIIAQRMVDISFFMSQVQQRMALLINQSGEHRGALWGSRFKSSILDGERALWTCVKYLELNPIRAGLVDDPAAYRFTSWGRYCSSGSHPFARHFVTHMRACLGEVAVRWSAAEVYAEFRGELARSMADDAGLDGDAAAAAKVVAMQSPNALAVAEMRMHYWIRGGIIGSEAFVREVAARFAAAEQVTAKKLGHLRDGPCEICSYAVPRVRL